MNNIIRWPLDLDQHEAQFDDTDEGELVAGLGRLLPCPLKEKCTTRHRPFCRPEPNYYPPCHGEICRLWKFRHQGLAHLDSLAEPAGEPLQPIKTESITRLEICMVLGVIGIVSLSILADCLSR